MKELTSKLAKAAEIQNLAEQIRLSMKLEHQHSRIRHNEKKHQAESELSKYSNEISHVIDIINEITEEN